MLINFFTFWNVLLYTHPYHQPENEEKARFLTRGTKRSMKKLGSGRGDKT